MQALHAGIAEQVWIFEVLDLKTSEAEVQKRMRNRKKKWKISSLNKNRNKLMIIVLGERKEPWRKLALRDLQFAELSLKIRARSVQSSDKKVSSWISMVRKSFENRMMWVIRASSPSAPALWEWFDAFSHKRTSSENPFFFKNSLLLLDYLLNTFIMMTH